MNYRFFAPIGWLATAVIGVLLAQSSVAAQQAATQKNQATKVAPNPAAPTRTPWGDPDLQGVYTFSTNTPLERPNGLAKDRITEDELALAERF